MRILKILGLNLALILFFSRTVFAQEQFTNTGNFGLQLSVNAAFGTHFQRLGINVNFYYRNGFFQANSEVRAYYNFRSLGPKYRYAELVLSQGVLFGYGAQKANNNPFFSSVSNQTHFINSFAYSYNAYFNKRKTTQQTGIFAFQFDKLSLITENDLFARPSLDRFRTAAFLIQYQYEDVLQAGLNCTMWTGRMGHKQSITHPKIISDCYMDTVGGVYTNTSHGLLSAQVKYNTAYAQNVQVNAGIDAEQVRNAVQNKFIHDMPLTPHKWHREKNCHIPMLDEKGNPYLYAEDQKIRKAKLFLNAFSNANVFY